MLKFRIEGKPATVTVGDSGKFCAEEGFDTAKVLEHVRELERQSRLDAKILELHDALLSIKDAVHDALRIFDR